MRLNGKRALIYGGGTGIGRACAEAMAREGATVFISGRRADVLRRSADEMGAGGRTGWEAGDATSAADVERVTTTAERFMGGLDTVLVSAGVAGRTPTLDTEAEEAQRILDGNLRPAFLAVRYAAPHLLAAGAGAVTIV